MGKEYKGPTFATLKVPEATVMRLSLYSRFLQQLDQNGVTMVLSADIARGTGVNSAQVRKDLAYFGEFGLRGVGYNVKDLYSDIINILGLNREWPVIIVGAGHLGQALSLYNGLGNRNFRVVGVFDNDPQKIGLKLNNLEILALDQLETVVNNNQVSIGVIAVPAPAAQEVANRLIACGIKAIVNFAPTAVSVPADVEIRTVDLTVNLEVLTYKTGYRPHNLPFDLNG